jgi:hypothetical protein
MNGMEAIDLVLASVGGLISGAFGLHRFFVPRGEAKAWRDQHDINSADWRRHCEKKIEAIEFSLSKTITRETLEDIMGPLQQDLRDIKSLLLKNRS